MIGRNTRMIEKDSRVGWEDVNASCKKKGDGLEDCLSKNGVWKRRVRSGEDYMRVKTQKP